MRATTKIGWRIGVDTGGTFTDLVSVAPSGEVRLRKVPSTPSQPSAACFEALARTEIDLSADLLGFVLGTTIATNALIQRTGAPTVFVTTAGFEDVLYIQRLDRAGVYDLQWVKSTPYALRHNTIGVFERILADGAVQTPLTNDELDRVVGAIAARIAGLPDAAIAVSLLFAYVNDVHERALVERISRAFPGTPVSYSSEVAPIWREYERSSTTVMDAYIKSIVTRFARSIGAGLGERRAAGSHALMKSNGGQVPLEFAGERPIEMVLSGLAGGMIAGAYWARAVGSQRAVTLDMGGTSADVGIVIDGQLGFRSAFELEFGIPSALPIIDVTTIGAGGSSIASMGYGGMLRVGPESAGADPGPACYGKGGKRPTITDANLVLGRLDPAYFLGGEIPLEVGLAEAALSTLVAPLGLEVPEVADAVISVSIENMAGAIRLVTVDRGHDYRGFDLVAFGGAGPLHAAEIVRRMGMRRAIIPPSPGLVSAFGAVIADERVDRRLTFVRRLDRPEGADVGVELSRLADVVRGQLDRQRRPGDRPIELSTVAACRYLGQNYEQEVPIDVEGPEVVARLVAAFHARHRQVYGYDLPDQPVQSVYLSATATIPSPPVSVAPYHGSRPGGPAVARRVLVSPGEWADALIMRRDDLPVGTRLEGPAIVEELDSTTYVPPGFVADVHETYCLVLSQRHAKE